jgi:OmpA-OmpF porin, OOP family
MNIMDIIKPYLTQTLMQKAGAWLGESESGVSKALGAMLPTLLGVILQKSDQRGFVDSLASLLGNPALQHGEVLQDAGNLFGAQSASSPVGQLGATFLNTLFGDKQQAVGQAISQHAGIGVGSVGKLFSAAAPLLLALLSKHAGSAGGLSSLLGLLGSQRSTLMSAIPGALGSVLGLGGTGAATAASSFNANSQAARPGKSGGFPLWLIPLFAIGALGIWFFMRPKTPEPVVFVNRPAPGYEDPAPTPNVAPAVVDPAPVTQPASTPAALELGAFSERMLPGDVKLNIPALGIESKLVSFIEDTSKIVDKETWFDFDRILFNTNAATLSAESNEQISNIAAILKAFPNVQLKIGGYTDNVGKPESNLKLSSERATAVMNAIVGFGVDAARLSAEGYGEAHPVADNATPEGQQKNRRVSARVTAK